MRFRTGLILFILALLVVLPLVIVKNSPRPAPPTPVAPLPRPAPQAPPDAQAAEPLREPDLVRARRGLSRCLQLMDLDEVDYWTGTHLERIHGGASKPFREFTREFLAAAGPDPVGVTRKVLGECSSRAARFLLISVLGEARRPESLSFLKEFVDDGDLCETAIYSIGMARSKEGYEFLIEDGTHERPGAVFGDDHTYYVRLQAIALHGARAIPFIEGHARANQKSFGVVAGDMLSWIRGADAVPALTRLLETDENEEIRKGAARALGCSSDPETLRYWLRRNSSDGAGWALAEPSDLPDIWEPTAAVRREIAERILPADAAIPEDFDRTLDLIRLGALCGPEKAKSFFERVASKQEPDEIGRTMLVHYLFHAFADQPGLSIDLIEKAGGRPVASINGGTWEEISFNWIPWKKLASTVLERELADLMVRSVEEVSGEGFIRFALKAVHREATLSAALKEESGRMSPERKGNLLKCLAGIDGTKPEQFLVSVLRDDPDPNFRLAAAAAYLRGGGPAVPDPAALRSIAEVVTRAEWEDPSQLRSLPLVIGAYYSRYGTVADIPRLQQLPEVLFYADEEEIRPLLKSATLRAIDAIRLRGN